MFGLKAAWGHAACYLPNDVRLAMLCGIVLATPLAAQLALRLPRACRPASLPAVVPGELLFHRRGTASMAVIFLLSAMRLAAGTYNPFIYFRF